MVVTKWYRAMTCKKKEKKKISHLQRHLLVVHSSVLEVGSGSGTCKSTGWKRQKQSDSRSKFTQHSRHYHSLCSPLAVL